MFYVAVMCRSLASPNFGTVATSTGDNSIGAIATYSCDTGYELVGSETRECLVSGQWTSSMPYCRGEQSGYIDEEFPSII